MRAPARWRLVLDGTRCDAHGMCALVAPETIALDPWGYAVPSLETISDEATLARARRAVAACPAAALSLRPTAGR